MKKQIPSLTRAVRKERTIQQHQSPNVSVTVNNNEGGEGGWGVLLEPRSGETVQRKMRTPAQDEDPSAR